MTLTTISHKNGDITIDISRIFFVQKINACTTNSGNILPDRYSFSVLAIIPQHHNEIYELTEDQYRSLLELLKLDSVPILCPNEEN